MTNSTRYGCFDRHAGGLLPLPWCVHTRPLEEPTLKTARMADLSDLDLEAWIEWVHYEAVGSNETGELLERLLQSDPLYVVGMWQIAKRQSPTPCRCGVIDLGDTADPLADLRHAFGVLHRTRPLPYQPEPFEPEYCRERMEHHAEALSFASRCVGRLQDVATRAEDDALDDRARHEEWASE